MSTSANNEDPDEMQHNAAMHFTRGYTVCKGKKNISSQKNRIFLENYNLTPLDIYNGLPQI